MAVTLGSIAAALLGFAGVAQRGEGAGHEARRRHPLLRPVQRVIAYDHLVLILQHLPAFASTER